MTSGTHHLIDIRPYTKTRISLSGVNLKPFGYSSQDLYVPLGHTITITFGKGVLPIKVSKKLDRILLLYHKKFKVWLYPGGHVEVDENPEEALLREVREETGLQIEILGEKDENLSDRAADVSALHIPYAMLCERVGDHYHNDIIYLCRIVGKNYKFSHNQKKSDGIGFFGLNDLKNIKLFPNFRKLLEKVLGHT